MKKTPEYIWDLFKNNHIAEQLAWNVLINDYLIVSYADGPEAA